MKVKDITKGDIIYYRNGRVNIVNKASQYYKYFTNDFKNVAWNGYDIVKIKRYVKILWFYKLKTIYKRYYGEN